jgi:hypothetical protein
MKTDYHMIMGSNKSSLRDIFAWYHPCTVRGGTSTQLDAIQSNQGVDFLSSTSQALQVTKDLSSSATRKAVRYGSCGAAIKH